MQRQFLLATPAETMQLGQEIGTRLFAGAVVALIGPLGAGKTTLTRAIALQLGADGHQIASPTFALIHEYPARLPICHIDAYRLNSSDELLALGIDEYLTGAGVCIIEWADRVAGVLPNQRLQIELALSDDARCAQLTAYGERYDSIIRDLPNLP